MSVKGDIARRWGLPFRGWYWGLVPLLAMAAYGSVLGVGFLMDDHILLNLAQQPGIDGRALLPFPDSPWIFYRPVGVLFTWELGWELWGLNPWPYHLTSLLLHAGCALVLGLWLAEATGRRCLGWTAGVLFGVFPLHLEAVAWLASQWDVLAALFGLLSLWAFTVWWKAGEERRRWWLYASAVGLLGLGVFAKESLFTFPVVLGAAAWYVRPPREARGWAGLGLVLLPFVALVGFNVGLRVAMTGGLGNYPTARGDIGAFFWDSLTTYMRVLLAPVNPAALGSGWVQAAGAVSSLAVVVGLAVWGRAQRRLLLLAGLWVLAAILPVLNSPFLVKVDDLQNNRYLYLPAAGYCVAVAALAYAAVLAARRWRPVWVGLGAFAVVACMGIAWAQLQPWLRSSVQAKEITRSLWELIPPPPQPRQNGMVWYAENVPYAYKGAYMLYVGLGLARVLTYGGGDYPNVSRLPNEGVNTAAEAPIAEGNRDAFAFRLGYDARDDLYRVAYIAGVTSGSAPPDASQSEEGSRTWDFRDCAADAVSAWEVVGAQWSCVAREGVVLQPEGGDPQMIGPDVAIQPVAEGEFLRLRVGLHHTATESVYEAKWYWRASDGEFSEGNARSVLLRRGSESSIYWTFLGSAEVGPGLGQLRFDPVDRSEEVAVEWIAMDVVR